MIASGLSAPSRCSASRDQDRLFVTDNATGEIIAYDLDGLELGRAPTGAQSIMGITIGPDGKLWFVDHGAKTVVRLDP